MINSKSAHKIIDDHLIEPGVYNKGVQLKEYVSYLEKNFIDDIIENMIRLDTNNVGMLHPKTREEVDTLRKLQDR